MTDGRTSRYWDTIPTTQARQLNEIDSPTRPIADFLDRLEANPRFHIDSIISSAATRRRRSDRDDSLGRLRRASHPGRDGDRGRGVPRNRPRSIRRVRPPVPSDRPPLLRLFRGTRFGVAGGTVLSYAADRRRFAPSLVLPAVAQSRRHRRRRPPRASGGSGHRVSGPFAKRILALLELIDTSPRMWTQILNTIRENTI